jgi:hypothetical protein
MIDRFRRNVIAAIRYCGGRLRVFAGRVAPNTPMPYALISLETNFVETYSNGSAIRAATVTVTVYHDGSEPTASRAEAALNRLDFAKIPDVLHCLPLGVTSTPTPETFRGKPLATVAGRWQIMWETRRNAS